MPRPTLRLPHEGFVTSASAGWADGADAHTSARNGDGRRVGLGRSKDVAAVAVDISPTVDQSTVGHAAVGRTASRGGRDRSRMRGRRCHRWRRPAPASTDDRHNPGRSHAQVMPRSNQHTSVVILLADLSHPENADRPGWHSRPARDELPERLQLRSPLRRTAHPRRENRALTRGQKLPRRSRSHWIRTDYARQQPDLTSRDDCKATRLMIVWHRLGQVRVLLTNSFEQLGDHDLDCSARPVSASDSTCVDHHVDDPVISADLDDAEPDVIRRRGDVVICRRRRCAASERREARLGAAVAVARRRDVPHRESARGGRRRMRVDPREHRRRRRECSGDQRRCVTRAFTGSKQVARAGRAARTTTPRTARCCRRSPLAPRRSTRSPTARARWRSS